MAGNGIIGYIRRHRRFVMPWKKPNPRLPAATEALPGRQQSMAIPEAHFVHQSPLRAPFPYEMQQIVFGMGCFWGAERRFWQQQGVFTTAVGYAGGTTPNPTYEEVCSGQTGHAEVVLVVFGNQIGLDQLLQLFWESHDPTQGMRQGNDVGSQYRSAIYCSDDAQLAAAEHSAARYADALRQHGCTAITTEICLAPTFYYAEAYHQQYLAKNPQGYCGLRGTGVCLPPATA